MTSLPTPLADCVRIAAASILPTPRVPLSAWADEHMRLSSESSVQPGPWTSMPFQVEPLDCLSPHSPYQTVVLVWASQMSKSSLMLASIANTIDTDPGPILMVQPTLSMAEAFGKDRLAPMFRDTPALRGKVFEAKSREAGSTILHRRFTGGHITIVGSNSAAGLASRPIRYVLLDEVDRFEASAGAEGDPAALAIARTRTFWNRKIVFASSPTAKDHSRIEAAWLESDQRELYVPCPLCRLPQVLKWPRVEWPDGQPAAAAYRCEGCEQLIPHHRKAWMLANCRWKASRPGAASAGFHLSELYSPWREWGELAEDWQKAQGNPERLRAFINTSLAEWWDDQAQTSVDVVTLLGRRESFPSHLPDLSAVLTAGVDVQADRLELELVAWGRGEESWSIEYKVIPGDPLSPEPWRALDEYLARTWTHRRAGSLPVAACAVDSGFATQAVYEFAGPRFGRRVFAVKGKAGNYPTWPKKPSRKAGTLLYTVGVDAAKATIMGRLRIPEPGPGYSHFPTERREEFFDQLLSETLVTQYRKGRPVREWRRKKNTRAEALDCRVYAYSALQALVSMGLRLDSEVDRMEAADSAAPALETYKVYRSRWMS